MHHSQFLSRLLEEGRLRVAGDDAGAMTVTLHDPCYLTRYNGVIDEPARRAAARCPASSCARWSKNGRQTFCCGAGGGRMWMEEKRGTRINAERTRQALETGAETVATACPFCLAMMRDGLKDAANRGAGQASAQDIAEILAPRVMPAQWPAPAADAAVGAARRRPPSAFHRASQRAASDGLGTERSPR